MVVCVVRRSRRWAEGGALDPWAASFALAERVAVWDAMFAVPYREYRRRLDEIRRGSLPPFDRVLDSWEPEAERLAGEPGNLICPTDEDDWLHPDLPEVVRGSGEAVRWRYCLFSPGRVETFGSANPGLSRVQSCCYALPTPAPWDALMSERVASDTVFGERFADLTLSVHCRTIASATAFLRPGRPPGPPGPSELAAEWERACGDIVVSGPAPPGCFWDMIERVRVLTRSLYRRRGPIPL